LKLDLGAEPLPVLGYQVEL